MSAITAIMDTEDRGKREDRDPLLRVYGFGEKHVNVSDQRL